MSTKTLPQLLSLLLLTLLGTLLSVLFLPLFSLVSGYSMAEINEDVELLRLVQFVSASCMFLAPGLIFARLHSADAWDFLHLRTKLPIRGLLLGLGGLFLLSPLVSLTTYLNESLSLPSFLAPIEEWMRAQEDSTKSLVQKFFVVGGMGEFVQNVVVISLMAGLSEEVFFRGALQRIMERATRNPHLVIWATAAIFSAIHLQFYGFLPRMILGAFLGYLLLWTGSLWVPILVHAANNLLSIVVMSSESLKANDLFSGELQASDVPGYLFASVLGLLAFYYCARKRS